MNVTQEAIFAEINYRQERARAAALGEQVRKARRRSRKRRWLTRLSRHPGRVGGRSDEAHVGQRHRVSNRTDARVQPNGPPSATQPPTAR